MNKHLTTLALLTLIHVTTTIGQDRWTPENIIQYKNISQVDLSPDAKHVAYTVREANVEGENSEYVSQIWLATSDGTSNIQYTYGEKSSTAPQFSPDGSALAFLSNRSEDKNQLYIMRVAGGEAKKVTNQKKGISAFKWSPDGNHIAFMMSDVDTEEDEKKKKEKRDVIIVDDNHKYNHIYTVAINIDSTPVKQITAGDFSVTSFDWSPDGNQIVFAHSPDPTINTRFTNMDISLVPADSGAVRSLVKRPGVDKEPLFSPDGKTIVFTSHGGQPEAVGLSDIYSIKITGGTPQAWPHTPDRNATVIAWSEDGNHVYAQETAKTSVTLYKIPVGHKNNPLYNNLTPSEGTSSSFSVVDDKLAYVYESPNEPEELFVSNLDGKDKRKLSEVNKDFNLASLGKTELLSWTSSDDLEIEGLVTYPADYKKGNKYPVVLQIHGGPGGVFTKGFIGQPSIYIPQLFAQEGYIVLRPNPRGSRGYGKEFRYANVQDWGYGDYQDLITGVDHIIELGIADKNKQYVMGWSYGGYMTSWVVTQTDRFQAASMGAGLPNLISMTTTTDIGVYLTSHMGNENFWDNYELYEKHSPIYHFHKVVTPTQVLHGSNDLRVPFTQGQEFYNALKMKGVDTEMIVYPRTPHGPREPKLLMDVTPRILAWFKKNTE